MVLKNKQNKIKAYRAAKVKSVITRMLTIVLSNSSNYVALD